jgi:hypothetical protein
MGAAGYPQVFNVKWLAINLPVQIIGEKFAEGIRIDVAGQKNSFGRIGSGTRKVIMLGKHIGRLALGNAQCGREQKKSARDLGPSAKRKTRQILHVMFFANSGQFHEPDLCVNCASTAADEPQTALYSREGKEGCKSALS